MIMNEDFITFELAKKLKEKGFREKCIATYDIGGDEFDFNNYVLRVAYQMNVTAKDCLRLFNDTNTGLIDAPTISQVLKWLREEKDIHIEIFLYDGTYSCLIKSIVERAEDDLPEYHKLLNMEDTSEYATYEQAALAGIEYCLDKLI